MALFIVIPAVVLATVIAAALLAWRLVPQKVVYDVEPDVPVAFGSDMAWLAIRTTDAAAVIELLELEGAEPANWNSGVGAIYDPSFGDRFVFVSPPVKGWTLVAGLALPMPASANFVEKLHPLLSELGRRFTDIQYFAAFPIIDFFGWARIDRGRVTRAFAVGEAGVVWDLGKPTAAERRLGLSLMELRGIKGRLGDVGGPLVLHPTERHVFSLASVWSLDPMGMAPNVAPGVGMVARAPQSWRPERLRRAA